MAGTFKSTNPYGTGGAKQGQFKPGPSTGTSANKPTIFSKAVTTGQGGPSKPAVVAPKAPKTAAKPAKVAAKPAAPKPVASSGGASFASTPFSAESAGAGGGMSGGGGGGGGMSGGASDFTAAPVPAMQTLTIPDAMSEQSYQEQIAQLARNMADFKAQQDLADNQYTGSFNQASRKLGVNGDKFDRNLQGGQYGQSVAANENDFAARGGLRSGLFVKSQSDLDSDFNSRLGEMNRARGDFRDTAALSRQNLESQNEIARQQALQSAVAAVAARYGVNSDQVGRGSSNTIQRAI